MINIALLVDDPWLGFAYCKILGNFAANEYLLDSCLHLYAEILELFLNIICRFLIYKRYDHTDNGSWFFGRSFIRVVYRFQCDLILTCVDGRGWTRIKDVFSIHKQHSEAQKDLLRHFSIQRKG